MRPGAGSAQAPGVSTLATNPIEVWSFATRSSKRVESCDEVCVMFESEGVQKLELRYIVGDSRI